MQVKANTSAQPLISSVVLNRLRKIPHLSPSRHFTSGKPDYLYCPHRHIYRPHHPHSPHCHQTQLICNILETQVSKEIYYLLPSSILMTSVLRILPTAVNILETGTHMHKSRPALRKAVTIQKSNIFVSQRKASGPSSLTFFHLLAIIPLTL